VSVMPAPVAGAIIVFVVCFMMTSGLQIMLSTKPDSRKTFVLGTALCFGLSLDILPELYAHVTPWLRPLFESSLTLSTVVAIILYQLLRFGSGSSVRAVEAPVAAPPLAALPAAPAAPIPLAPNHPAQAAPAKQENPAAS